MKPGLKHLSTLADSLRLLRSSQNSGYIFFLDLTTSHLTPCVIGHSVIDFICTIL